MGIKANPTIAAIAAAAIGFTATALSPASAASPRTELKAGKAGATDISARRRHHRRGNNAAVVGAVTGLFGAIASVAAANAWRDSHPYRYYRPYYGPAYGPYAYEPYPYYGPRW